MKLAEIYELIVGPDSPVAFRGHDGSTAGSSDPVATIVVNRPEGLHYFITSPNHLGAARAYVTGAVDIEGDLYAGLFEAYRRGFRHLTLRQKLEIARSVGLTKVRRPPLPEQEARLSGWRHSKRRDAAAISHHYDVSNAFYEILLGPSMAYTCAVFPTPDATLEEAQTNKFDLVCQKLGLKPGMRLLDVGCGWGGMVTHAAKEYGVEAIGVTLSKQQAEWGAKAIANAGLTDRAEIRAGDYRDVPESGFDRISSIGLTEHIGYDNYPSYFEFLLSKLKPEGRLLNHTITRDDGTQRPRAGGFINRYIFPDGELAGPAQVMGAMNDAGFEIQHEENFRRHYAKTLSYWLANLEERWDEAVAEVGLGKARTWRLYLAGSEMGFDLNKIQLHQFLGTKTTSQGDSGYPWRHEF